MRTMFKIKYEHWEECHLIFKLLFENERVAGMEAPTAPRARTVTAVIKRTRCIREGSKIYLK